MARGTTAVAGPAHDSHQRREELSEHLGKTIAPQHAEASEARFVADKANATPVSDVAGLESSGGLVGHTPLARHRLWQGTTSSGNRVTRQAQRPPVTRACAALGESLLAIKANSVTYVI